MKEKKTKTFEEQFKNLEDIVRVLDEGEVPLEQLLVRYEEGVKIADDLREFLENAEQRIINISKARKTDNNQKQLSLDSE